MSLEGGGRVRLSGGGFTVGPGPSIRLGPGPSKGEYVRFTVATLNALRTFSRCHRCILWVSIMFLMILRISGA